MTPLSGRRAHYKAGAADIQRTVDAAVQQLAAERDEARAAAKACREATETTRHRYTRDELTGARAVRDRYGWHKVTRVNGKTVTVETGYSWTARIALEDVLEARS